MVVTKIFVMFGRDLVAYLGILFSEPLRSKKILGSVSKFQTAWENFVNSTYIDTRHRFIGVISSGMRISGRWFSLVASFIFRLWKCLYLPLLNLQLAPVPPLRDSFIYFTCRAACEKCCSVRILRVCSAFHLYVCCVQNIIYLLSFASVSFYLLASFSWYQFQRDERKDLFLLLRVSDSHFFFLIKSILIILRKDRQKAHNRIPNL